MTIATTNAMRIFLRRPCAGCDLLPPVTGRRLDSIRIPTTLCAVGEKNVSRHHPQTFLRGGLGTVPRGGRDNQGIVT